MEVPFALLNICSSFSIIKMIITTLGNIPGKHEFKELQKKPYCALHTYCGKC